MQYLHKRDIIHRDLKSANLLLTKSGSVKVADFGLARTEAQDHANMTAETGTVRWMAPEVRVRTADSAVIRTALTCCWCLLLAFVCSTHHLHCLMRQLYLFNVTFQVIDHRPYSRKVDIYSFGIVLWEICTCQSPFEGYLFVKLVHDIVAEVSQELMNV